MKSTDAVEESLGKIEKIDRSGYALNSVLAVASAAIEQARFFDQQSLELPLQGLPILIKDNIEVRGLPASAGSLALADTVVAKDSTIARRLRAAGAVIVGATNLSEWANIRSTKSASGWSAIGGLTANPWQHSRSAGGSSSGSGAAVAAGLTQWAIGTETDGSIICPASLNGCVGIKPTVGIVPRDGVIPISASQDSPGPMAQTVAQAALLLDVLTDRNIYAAAANSDSQLRIGVVDEWMTSSPEVNANFEHAISRLQKTGAQLSRAKLAAPEKREGEDELFVLLYELAEGLRDYLDTRPNARVLTLQDIVDFNVLNSAAELKHFGQELFEKALEFESRRDDYVSARERNLLWAEQTLAGGLADVDVLIGCTFGPAWQSSLHDGDSYEVATWITTAPAIAGTPVGTVPMGLVSGLPVGLGFVSARNQEAKLITAMAQAEKALDLGVLKPTFIK